jgi:DSF synthase
MNNILYTNEILLKNFEHLEVRINPHQKAAWLYFNPSPRSCFTLTLLKELSEFQSILRNYKGKLPCNGELINIEYNVITSHHPVFSFGGDLDYFIKCIEKKDRNSLTLYARYCIDAVYYNHIGREFDITTISLIHGNALGGGCEAALSSHVLIAERSAEMGLPEVLFNLFPGMGAYQLLTQRVSPHMAERMMTNGRLYTAEELFDLGIIDFLVEDGDGKSAVDLFIRNNNKRKNSTTAIRKIRQLVNPISYQQLLDIGDVWVDAAINLSERDIQLVKRLIHGQERFAAQGIDFQKTQVTAS